MTSSNRRLAITIDKVPDHLGTGYEVYVDDSRDALLTPFGKFTLKKKYLSPNESYQDRFANCSRYYSDDQAHADRLYGYLSKLWFIPATPILSNGGTTRGQLISCYLNTVEDSMQGIVSAWNDNIWMSAKGGGIGSYYGKVRGAGEKAGVNGKTSGQMSFAKVNDAFATCITQGGNRGGAAAIFTDISHPDIEGFIEMRRVNGGDPAMKAINLHHGVCIPDAFYHAVDLGLDWDLISPHTGQVIRTVSARGLFQKLITARLETGEPYIVNIDHVNRAIPEFHRRSKLFVQASNLCVEITLPTGIDQHGRDRNAVCCLSQLNLETYDEWKDDKQFIHDVARFLDNVLTDYIDHGGEEFVKARYSASQERSIGVGTMGWHSYLQQHNIPMESALAKALNIKIFSHLKTEMNYISKVLAEERGACPDAAAHGFMERFSNKLAQAPTATTSIICGGAAPGIDPFPANIFTHKTTNGTFIVKNKYLERLLERKGLNQESTWTSILENGGSVQHLDFLTDNEKLVYKTEFEFDQRWLIELASDRQKFICQSQSLNLFFLPDMDKWDLMMIHLYAWEKGIKTLYYMRSMSSEQATASSGVTSIIRQKRGEQKFTYEECVACS